MSWTPSLTSRSDPLYITIVNALAEDIAQGSLKPGTRLPTHRDLAYRLGVTVGTITRAYAEAERRGLLLGEVGRGTFVRAATGHDDIHDNSAIPINLTAVVPGIIAMASSLIATTFKSVADDPQFSTLMTYHPYSGIERHRRMGAKWLQLRGVDADPAQVVVTSGAQHGVMIAFAAAGRAGETVVAESLSYGSVRATADLLGMKIRGLAMDEQGLVPEAFDAACRSSKVRILYCLPTLHNPTTIIMPADRRRAIAEIARRYEVIIVEDDIYRPLASNPPPPLSFYAPERTITVAGLSKALVPGLRAGYLHAPTPIITDLTSALRASIMMTNPIMNEVIARLIESGDANHILEANRLDARQRQDIARETMPGMFDHCASEACHLWLRLPAPWTAESFTAMAREHGVSVWSSDRFYLGLNAAPAAVRLSLGAAGSHERLRRGLTILQTILDQGPQESTPLV